MKQFLYFRMLLCSCATLLSGVSLMPLDRAAIAEDAIDFNRDIRPILSDKCYACHGPDENERQADLRFDAGLEGISGESETSVIVPGSADDSELVARILADDSDVMPPEDHPKKLTESEKQLLVEWINSGAHWAQHWAYEAPKKPQIPSSSKNLIDAFVGERLADEGLEAAKPAAPHILLRRLYFDLLGLPPDRETVQEFVANYSDEMYQQTVDELLDSPHFGERMAIYWLDLVRYADTVGYHGDQDVSISPYRDYVIKAFNDNKPFDAFTREQLAGDLLPDPKPEQMIASGYNRLGMMSAEGGVQPEEYLAKYAADRVRNASTVWLGSTLGCAECHDHKFDPFTTKDFYRFASFFADIKERGLYSGANRDGNWGPQVDVPADNLPELLAPIDERLAAIEASIEERLKQLSAERNQWQLAAVAELEKWKPVEVVEATALHGTKLTVQDDQRILASGKSPATNTYTLRMNVQTPLRSLRVEVLPDKSLPQQGPGRAGNGNFVISEIKLRPANEESQLKWQSARANHEQADGSKNPYGAWAAAATIDSDSKGASWGWAILPRTGKPNALVLELEETAAAGEYELVIEQNHTNPTHTLGCFRLSTASDAGSTGVAEPALLSEAEKDALLLPEDERTTEQKQALDNLYRSLAPELEDLRKQLAVQEDLRKKTIADNTRTTLITVAIEPREMRVLPRGNWMDQSGEVVTPAIPEFLGELPPSDSSRPTRLDLANWLVSKDNPLTARVFVNRLWKLYFGIGLSKVLDDLGSQGELPSHPELLDALACEFMESGWDIKHIIRLIVTSETYRQSSRVSAGVERVDPYNRLIARQGRFRLDAEMIRDNALAISGLLVDTVGGRSVKPYQPAGLYRHLNFPARTYKEDSGPEQYRRGVYTHWQRQFLHPAMQAFDAPSREECTAERPRSNTPLAALVLLNDPSYVEAARRFAERVLTEGGDSDEERFEWMMQTALSRKPLADEVVVFRDILQTERSTFAQAESNAQELTKIGQSSVQSDLPVTELAAWTQVTRVVFNLHEMVTRN